MGCKLDYLSVCPDALILLARVGFPGYGVGCLQSGYFVKFACYWCFGLCYLILFGILWA